MKAGIIWRCFPDFKGLFIPRPGTPLQKNQPLAAVPLSLIDNPEFPPGFRRQFQFDQSLGETVTFADASRFPRVRPSSSPSGGL
jgi:hypothetical protein